MVYTRVLSVLVILVFIFLVRVVRRIADDNRDFPLVLAANTLAVLRPQPEFKSFLFSLKGKAEII